MKKILSSLLLFIFLLSGCGESKDSPTPDSGQQGNNTPSYPSGKSKQVTLVYAVNRNNLSSALDLNMHQMLEALKGMAEGENTMFVFKTFMKELADNSRVEMGGLYKAVSGSEAEFVLQKEYTRDILSTDPVRMKEVIEDVLQEQGEIYNLFFWGHGMAWTPYFSDHNTTRGIAIIGNEDMPEVSAFGGDNNNRDWADIDEIKSAIPDGRFETIWFDCCYMSNIETIYELRNKCNWMVAYPTEIAAAGLPYHEVLPFVLSYPQNLKGGAEALYNYYNATRTAVTAAVMDMSKIEGVANACKAVYTSGEVRPKSYGLQNYSRSSSNPYYDLGQYVREYAEANDAETLITPFSVAMNEFVVYCVASEKDFNYKPIIESNYCGVSTHLFNDTSTEKDEYYRGLDWYKATYAAGL